MPSNAKEHDVAAGVRKDGGAVAGGLDVDERLEWLVVDDDLLSGIGAGLRRVAEHDRHGLAHVAHDVGDEEPAAHAGGVTIAS